MKTCSRCHLRYPNESTYCFIDGTTLTLAADPRIGSTIAGRYVIDEIIGIGGMATVYRARHKLVDRPCAIKILNVQYAQDPITRERFQREAKHAHRLAHPNIIEMFDQGDTEDGAPFLAMELLKGTTLADAIARTPMALSRALPIFVHMTRALARAHDFQVIHRDLKPENVFLLDGDIVKLLDFGIARCAQDARLTSTGEIFGTPQYMAPERGSSSDCGPAADLYALGIIFFEVLTQKLPFDAKDPASWLIKHMKETPPRLRQYLPSAPQSLDNLIFSLMAKKPQDRPHDAHNVLTTLQSIALEQQIALPHEPEMPPQVKSSPAPARGIDQWLHRISLFRRMQAKAQPLHGGPISDTNLIDMMERHVTDIRAIRNKALSAQETAEVIEQEGREGRVRLGRAMDVLGIDLSRMRDRSKELDAAIEHASLQTKAFIPRILEQHREVLRWEGRTGFAEPHPELAHSYRAIANLVDQWVAEKEHEKEAVRESQSVSQAIQDLEFQIDALRTSLTHFERGIDDRLSSCNTQFVDYAQQADQLEAELLHLASRFCAPLRNRPDLSLFFVELEQDRVQSSEDVSSFSAMT